MLDNIVDYDELYTRHIILSDAGLGLSEETQLEVLNLAGFDELINAIVMLVQSNMDSSYLAGYKVGLQSRKSVAPIPMAGGHLGTKIPTHL